MRGTAILLVIIEHAIVLPANHMPASLIGFAAALAPFRMPALMFLSGLLLARSLAKPAAAFLAGKVDRILWPYLLWSVVFYVMTIPGEPPPNFFAELLLHPTSPTWFLAYLFIYYCIGLVVPPPARLAVLILSVFLAQIFGSSELAVLGTRTPNDPQRFWMLLAFFLTGDFLSRHGIDIPMEGRRRFVRVVAWLSLVATALAMYRGVPVQLEPLFMAPVLAIIVLAASLLPSVDASIWGRMIAALGRNSIVFFVLHWPMQVAVVRLVPFSGWALFATSVTVGIVGPALFLALRRQLPVVNRLFDLGLRGGGRRVERQHDDAASA